MSSTGLGAGLLFARSTSLAFSPPPFPRSAEAVLVRTPSQGQKLSAGAFPMPPSLPAGVAFLKSVRSCVAIYSICGAVGRCLSSGAVLRRPSPYKAYLALAGRADFSSEPWVATGSRTVINTPSAQGAYEQYQQDRAADLPRPPLIQWERDLANAVQLIGIVGRNIDIKFLDSGKVLARTSLAVKTGSLKKDDTSWFELEIWDTLGEIAAQHIQKGERIFVTGKILVEKWMKDDVLNSSFKVVVRDFAFVEPYNKTYGQDESLYTPSLSDRIPEKSNVDATQRNWNQQRPANPPPGTASPKNYDATEKRWQEYFADPTQWWDNRYNKKNPKSPDFKHKSTQEALWLESWSNPPWVAEQMAVLEKQLEKQSHQGGNYANLRQQAQDKKLSSFRDSDFMY